MFPLNIAKPSKCLGEIAVNNKLRLSYHKNGKVKVNRGAIKGELEGSHSIKQME